MSALDRGLRRELAKAVASARRIAEAGARNALTALMVSAAHPDSSLTGEDRALRRRLRAHGRQLGDMQHGAKQEVVQLAHEIAYGHWHRMLFARFLAENSLLVEPKSRVSVSINECRELGRESGKDPWTLAGEYAAAMLPQIFRPDDPSLAVRLPPETQRELEMTLEDLHPAIFAADDAIGWTYQFWQTDRKKEVNERVKGGAKIGADELPAVTQLFTEPYMVRFLFHNTAGAWRAGRLFAERPELAEDAHTEDELREAVRLNAANGYDFDYLRFVREPRDGADESDASGPWRPAAGSFDKWPTRAAELRILDPCCGSGHFLVEGLHLLVRLRMEEEDLPVNDAIRAVLRDNLYGLEIDPRCAQVAAFSVAFAAWKLAKGVIDLPVLRIACSGLVRNATKEQWLALAERTAGAAGSAPRRGLHATRQTLASGALRHTFETLYDLFSEAPTLGSLIDPRQADRSLFTEDFNRIRLLLDSVLAERETDAERRERAVAASGMVEATGVLAGTYSLVITNVPYLARGKQGRTLRHTGDTRFPASKGDIATMFVERSFGWTGTEGAVALVVPQNWFSQDTYSRLRETILSHRRWRLHVRLGEHAFEDAAAAGAFAAISIISADTPENEWRMAGLDASVRRDTTPILAPEKAELIQGRGAIHLARQEAVRRNANCVITLTTPENQALLRHRAHAYQGIGTSDKCRYIIRHWESSCRPAVWIYYQMAPKKSAYVSGCHSVLRWENGQGSLAFSHRARVCGQPAWSRDGVAIAVTRALHRSCFFGTMFDCTIAAVIPEEPVLVPAVSAYVLSPEFVASVRDVDPALSVTESSFGKTVFDLDHWTQVAIEKYPNGMPEPYSDDPKQWVFHGHPCGSVVWNEESKRTADGPARADETVLQIAVARLLGYRWPAERNPEMRLAAEQRAWAKRCSDLDQFRAENGIVCLPAVGDEEPAAERLRSLLAAAYGSRWSTSTEQHLLRTANLAGKPVENLDDWLRRRFFAQHCRIFYRRPFIWHIWDGLPDGFHALVNYHQLAGSRGEGRRTLEALTFRYLGDWIDRQRAAQNEGTPGADSRLVAALELREQLKRILEGEPPLDLFIRWKPLHRQPVGWNPDIDDGIRMNIRPFLRAKLRRGGLKDAGILRSAPKIEWKKDGGQEPERLRGRRKGDPPQETRARADFPWFWACPGTGTEDDRTDFMGGPEFDGSRWNDLHYTLAAKRAARERHEREAQAEAAARDSAESPRTSDAGESA